MNWTKEKLAEETEKMQINEGDEIEELGLATHKGGRPKKTATIKTNLDLSADVLRDLDAIGEYMGSARQAVIKGFILSGINDYYKARGYKKAS